MKIATIPMLVLLAGCEGTHDLGKLDCLPLAVPAAVVLQQEAGLYRSPNRDALILSPHPREAANDDFHRLTQVRVLPPGTPLQIDRLSQDWGFDVGEGRISAFGQTREGDGFEFGWGFGAKIHRAPWEPATVGNPREVACET